MGKIKKNMVKQEQDALNQLGTIYVEIENNQLKYEIECNLDNQADLLSRTDLFMCDQCDYVTKHKSNLNSHKKVKHEKRVYKCPNCDVKTGFKQHLQKHMIEKHKSKTVYFCSHCEYSNEDWQEYTNHKSVEH